MRDVPTLVYTIPEVVAATSLSRTVLYEEIRAGRLRARKRGSSTIILVEDLQEYLRGLPLMDS